LNTEPNYYENAANKGAYENVEFQKTSATKGLCLGIARGVAHLHQAGALLHALSTKSVMIEEHNGRVLPKLTDFSLAPLVTHMDRLDFELVSAPWLLALQW
jgi:serine/threonine protein kinase